jgi:DNA-binding LacI/PurR family transcriptional regulator
MATLLNGSKTHHSDCGRARARWSQHCVRYLNGHYVSLSAKQRISNAIDKLGYTRSWTARNLSLGRRGCIGVVVDSTLDPWFIQLLAGIEEALSERDSSLMLASLELRGQYDASPVFQWIREKRVDGLIIAKSQKRERSLLRTAIEAQLTVITVVPDEAVDHVPVLRCNNLAGGAAVVDHLVDLGHRRIAFVGGPEHSIDSKNRMRGLRNRLAQLCIPLDPALIFSCDSWESDAGIEFGRTLLAKPLSFTALVTANDALALGLCGWLSSGASGFHKLCPW